MADDTDVLLEFCKLNWEEIRHIENQRATLANLIILIASAIVGLAVQQGLTRSFLPLIVLMILLGVYGIATTLKLHERYMFAQTRLEYYYERIDKMHPNAQFLGLRRDADEKHRTQFPRMTRLRVYYLWLTLYIAVSLMGCGLALVIIDK